MNKAPSGDESSSMHLVEHSRSNGKRDLVNGARIFAIFNAAAGTDTISGLPFWCFVLFLYN